MEDGNHLLFQHCIQSLPNLRVMDIPEHIDSKNSLFRFLAKSLDFPEYFGHNWDALVDIFYGSLNEDITYVFIDNSNLDRKDMLTLKDICQSSFSDDRVPKIIFIERHFKNK
jgi:RNAse (barnase) inhibitor barstar